MDEVRHRFARCARPLRWVGWLILRLSGWRVTSVPLEMDRAVVIAAPHTSNWDFWFGLAGAWELGISWSWLGKDSLFRAPWGGLMKALGGVPVDRSAPHGMVGEAAAWLRERPGLFLVVPAEGTRKWAPRWKSGFYWMAVQAQVPIVLGFVDFKERRVGLGEVVVPTGDVRADMARIRAFYATKTAAFPELAGPVVLKEEEET